MSRYLVNTEEKFQALLGDLRELWRVHHYIRLNVKIGKDRSADQNELSHVWYDQIVRELREDDALGVKRFCKLHFGVPILRAEDDAFREFYDTAIKPHLSYEQKLKAMDTLDITSRMTVKQMEQYLDAMVEHYETRNVKLEAKKPELRRNAQTQHAEAA